MYEHTFNKISKFNMHLTKLLQILGNIIPQTPTRTLPLNPS